MLDTRPVADFARLVRDNVGRVIVGKDEVTTILIVAILCEGHVLIDDVPGVGKTTLARALARSLDLSFQRIQFTPDLLPSDVTGVSFFNQRTQEFQFRPGPIHANLVLADEINRATPRTQSSLLEAMEERQVTSDGETRRLPRPFTVLATENPIELEGTFPLPEAQLDRFLVRLRLGYPDRDEERQIARRFRGVSPLDQLQPVAEAAEIVGLSSICRDVHVGEAVECYLVDLVRATRLLPGVELGASPRATLGLYRTGQALAAIRGRNYVLPDDVRDLAPAVLGHRIIISAASRFDGRSSPDLVGDILASVPVPVED
ncbi:MAG TPA: MoxR family ATPase, partial [Chloroflexota bacterium]|nr:MoxR family ATPase [Chloroflexota bacterium]